MLERVTTARAAVVYHGVLGCLLLIPPCVPHAQCLYHSCGSGTLSPSVWRLASTHVTRHRSLPCTATVATARLASLEPCPPTYLASLLRLLQPLTLVSLPPPRPRRLTFAHQSNQPHTYIRASTQTRAWGLAGKSETKLDAAIQILHTGRELGFRQEARVSVVVFVKHLGYFIVCLDVHEPVFACRLVQAQLASQDMMPCRAGRAETSVQGSKTCRSSPSRCILPEVHSPSNFCTSFVAICMTHFT